MLSMNTDYCKDTGSPEPYLERIGEAGFSHVHWCHQWNSDFLYSSWEVDEIRKWLEKSGLKLLDLHASVGQEKNWVSLREYERLSGLELVRNRIEMTGRLGADATILHIPGTPEGSEAVFRDALRRSIDSLESFARARRVRIAVENDYNYNLVHAVMKSVFAEYGPDFLGLCYDSGHGNMDGGGLDQLESLKDRLIAVHLHDNDGKSDQHKLPFSGTVDWPRLAKIIAGSSYGKCLNLEVTIHGSGIGDERAFLAEAFERATAFGGMVEKAQSGGGA